MSILSPRSFRPFRLFQLVPFEAFELITKLVFHQLDYPLVPGREIILFEDFMHDHSWPPVFVGDILAFDVIGNVIPSPEFPPESGETTLAAGTPI